MHFDGVPFGIGISLVMVLFIWDICMLLALQGCKM